MILMTEETPYTWLELHGDYLYSYANTRLSRREVAEDLVQDTLLAAIHSYDRFEGRSSVRTWLTAILRRKIVDHYRKAEYGRQEEMEDDRYPFVKKGPNQGDWKPEHAPGNWPDFADKQLENSEFREILEYCLGLLPENLRSVFVLKVLEELETSELCKEMGLTSSNYWVIMHRARLKLRECMESNWL